MNRRDKILIATATVVMVALMIVLMRLGILTVHGWDWSIGTRTHYCGVYLPHHDFYCEVSK